MTYLETQRSLLELLREAVSVAGSTTPPSALSNTLLASGIETAALTLLSARPPTRSEHPLLVILRIVPVADVALALLRKDFVPGSNPASHALLQSLAQAQFAANGRLRLSGTVATIQANLSSCRLAGVPCD